MDMQIGQILNTDEFKEYHKTLQPGIYQKEGKAYSIRFATEKTKGRRSYPDYWVQEGKILAYTGQGSPEKGEQKENIFNKSLINNYHLRRPVLVFETIKKGKYKYWGNWHINDWRKTLDHERNQRVYHFIISDDKEMIFPPTGDISPEKVPTNGTPPQPKNIPYIEPDFEWNEANTLFHSVVPYLVEIGIPRSSMQREFPIKFATATYFIDILACNLIVEVKKPKVNLTEKVVRQAFDYLNQIPSSELILVTNGINRRWFKKDSDYEMKEEEAIQLIKC